jgi:hypothetical protein
VLDASSVEALKRAVIFRAVASWSSLAFFTAMFLPLVFSHGRVVTVTPHVRQLFLVLLVLCSGLWALAFAAAWPTLCGTCHKRVFFKLFLSPKSGLSAARQQFWPSELLRGAQATCPNCGATIKFETTPDA